MRRAIAVLALASAAAAFLISNSPIGGRFVFEHVPANRRPINILVDTEGAPGIPNAIAETQELMNQWNNVVEASDAFGLAAPGGPYNGGTAGVTFGRFTDQAHEVAFDDTGAIFPVFGVGASVLGITLKSVDTNSGQILDFLVVVNTQAAFIVAPGTGATSRELIRGTLLHELGHALGLGHTPVGLVNQTTFGFSPASPQRMPSMYPFRLPLRPQEGETIEADDIAGITEVYPADTSGLGSISGTVRSASGAPINEILVRIVGPDGNDNHLGILTNADGSDLGTFRIPNVPPGGYRVLVESVNGRGSVDSTAIAGATSALGGNAFILAVDEHWQPGDTFDPAVDDPAAFSVVQVRPGRDTASIDFVLNGAPIVDGQTSNDSLMSGDAQLPDAGNGFHYVDYHVFDGTGGQPVTISVAASGFTPQLQLLLPSDLTVAASHEPVAGSMAALNGLILPQTGVFTIAVSARAVTGNPAGRGTYGLTLNGAGASLPMPPVLTGAASALGGNSPGPQESASPVCALPLLQVRVNAPSHEQLWIDRVTLTASGSGDDAADVVQVSLVHDTNGNGMRDGVEPVLATGTFAADNGTLALDTTLAVPAGATADLLVVYDVTVTSVSSAGIPGWWTLALLPVLLLLRRRAVVWVLLLALVPLSCGGGGGGSNCNGPFDPQGAIVDFEATVAPGGILAFTPTSAPGAPVPVVTGVFASDTLSVSN